MKRSWHIPLLTAVMAVSLLVFALSLAALARYSHRIGDERRHEQIAACERGNDLRLYVNAILYHHRDIRLPPLVIADCSILVK